VTPEWDEENDTEPDSLAVSCPNCRGTGSEAEWSGPKAHYIKCSWCDGVKKCSRDRYRAWYLLPPKDRL
jgi:hypothetical protein